jgi:pyruvate ferredoxin oxidoreductase delta subunit
MAKKEQVRPAELPTWEECGFGNILAYAGGAKNYRTGDWRTERPVVDHEKCIKCGMCWLMCPDAAIVAQEDGWYEPNLFYCKGCGICARICPKQAISMTEEGAE